jgi:hypothetical protein
MIGAGSYHKRQEVQSFFFSKATKISCLLYLFLFVDLNSFAQQLLPVSHDTLKRTNFLVLNGFGFHHSTSIKNDFTSKFLLGGVITDEIKDNSLEEQELFNKLGADVTSEITYFFKPNFLSEKKIGLYASLGQHYHFASEYAKDFYAFAFYGNQRFENSGISLGNTRAVFMNYSKLGFGVYDEVSKNRIGLNFIVVNDFNRTVINRGGLFNNTNDNLIDYDIDFYFQNASSFAFFQGAGVSLDFDYNMKIKDGGLFDGFVQIAGRNLGAVNMPRTQQWSMQNVGSYDGFSFADIAGSMGEDGQNIDLIDSLGIEQRVGSTMIALPGYVQIGKIVDAHSESAFQVFFGARMYTTVAFFPMVYAGGHYAMNENFFVGAQASYGGFGNFRAGTYLGYNRENLSIGLGTEDLLGIIPNIGFGRSALLRLTYKW